MNKSSCSTSAAGQHSCMEIEGIAPIDILKGFVVYQQWELIFRGGSPWHCEKGKRAQKVFCDVVEYLYPFKLLLSSKTFCDVVDLYFFNRTWFTVLEHDPVAYLRGLKFFHSFLCILNCDQAHLHFRTFLAATALFTNHYKF